MDFGTCGDRLRARLARLAASLPVLLIGLTLSGVAESGSATQPPIAVRVGVAQRDTIQRTIEYGGRLRPQRTIAHRADITGIVEDVRVAPGDQVQAGETLATLRRRSGSSEFRPVAVSARIDGIVTALSVSTGDELREGDEVAAIADTSTLTAELYLSDKDVEAVSRGDRVVARDRGRDIEFSGTVTRAALVPDYRTGLFPVQVSVNPGEGSFVGQFLRFEFEAGRTTGIMVEREHLELRRGAYHLFVVVDDAVELRRVELGEEFGDRVMIRGGLAEGERYVVWARRRLQDGQRVTVENDDNA